MTTKTVYRQKDLPACYTWRSTTAERKHICSVVFEYLHFEFLLYLIPPPPVRFSIIDCLNSFLFNQILTIEYRFISFICDISFISGLDEVLIWRWVCWMYEFYFYFYFFNFITDKIKEFYPGGDQEDFRSEARTTSTGCSPVEEQWLYSELMLNGWTQFLRPTTWWRKLISAVFIHDRIL